MASMQRRQCGATLIDVMVGENEKEAEQCGTNADALLASSSSSSTALLYLLFVLVDHHIIWCDIVLPPLRRRCIVLPSLRSH